MTNVTMTIAPIAACVDVNIGVSSFYTFGEFIKGIIPSKSVMHSILTCSLVLDIPGLKEIDLRSCI